MTKVRLINFFFLSLLYTVGLFSQASFSPPIISDCDTDTREIVLLNVNTDNFIDLAAISFIDGTATAMLGDGLGKFICQNSFEVGLLPTDLATGDFDNDGYDDLVVLTQDADDEVKIFLGTSTNQFTNFWSFDIGGPNDVVVADFDINNLDDLALAEGESNVKIAIGDGAGMFGQGGFYEVGEAPIVLFTDDLNRDDIPDLVVGHGLSNDFLIMFGDGTGQFNAPDFFPTGGNPYDFQFQDVTGDGYQDLIVAVNSEEAVIKIYKGNGIGGFTFYTEIPTVYDPLGIVAADLDNDQIIDIAVTLDVSDDDNIIIYKGQNSEIYSVISSLSTLGFPSQIKAIDIDKNGFMDLVVNDHRISVFLNNPITNGTRDWIDNKAMNIYPNPVSSDFISIQFINIPFGAYSIQIVDFSGKIISTNSTKISANQIIEIPVQHLPKGIFNVRLSNNQNHYTQKFVRH